MINSLEAQFDHLRLTVALRDKMLAELTDSDLAFTPGGGNPTLGELFREVGEVTQVYTDGFKTFTQDFDYRYPDADIAGSTARLAAWYKALDAEMETALAALSEDDIQNKTIVRPHWEASVTVMYHTYREAILIFAAKASVYFKAMGKPLTEQVLWWMG